MASVAGWTCGGGGHPAICLATFVSDGGDSDEAERSFRKEAELSKELVILERNVPLAVGKIDELSVGEHGERLRSYFAEHGFETLIGRLEGEGKKPALREAPPKKKKQAPML